MTNNRQHLFAYGTLMCEDIMEDVSGYRLAFEPGRLRDFRRKSVKGEHYPAIVPHEGESVEGVVYRDVPASAWERLDRFEGEMYARQSVQVELDNGSALKAAAYVWRPEYMDRLSIADWDFAEFLRMGKGGFQKDYKGFRSLS